MNIKVATCLILLFSIATSLDAQTIGPGTYDLPTDGNIGNVESIGSNTTINIFENGSIGNDFQAGLRNEVGENIVVNMYDGMIGERFEANSGSEVNIFGGTAEMLFTAGEGSVVNINGGTVNLAFSGGLARYFRAFGLVNINDGILGDFTTFGSAIVNVDGGNIRGELSLEGTTGNVVNQSGGYISRVTGYTDTVFNASGGQIGRLDATSQSSFVFTDGNAGTSSRARDNSSVTFFGGVTGARFDAEQGSDVKFVGGEFLLNGNAVSGNVSISGNDLLSGTLEDGSTFIFTELNGDNLSNVQLVAGTLSPIQSGVITVNDENSPNGIRSGETLNLESQGVLRRDFSAVGATLNVNGGSAGTNLEMVDSQFYMAAGVVDQIMAYSSEFDISGGTYDAEIFDSNLVQLDGDGGRLDLRSASQAEISGGTLSVGLAYEESELNVYGGEVGVAHIFEDSELNLFGGKVEMLFAEEQSDVNIYAASFFIDGVELESLLVGESLILTERDLVLSGSYSDGTQFSFDIYPFFGSDFEGDYVSTSATLTLSRIASVPEPGSATILLILSMSLLPRRYRKM